MSPRSLIAVAVLAVAAGGCPPPLAKAPRTPLFGETGTGTGSATTTAAKPDPGPDKPRPPAPKPSASADKLNNGVDKETIKPGSGSQRATGNDRVTVRYRPWAPELVLADAPTFVGDLPRLPTGIGDAVAAMAVGEHARIWVPAVDIKGEDAEPIVIDIELVSIQVAPPIPKDLDAPPAAAKKSPAGVARLVLTKGGGEVRPTPQDEVVVTFTAWASDGLQLETTVWDGTPSRTWQVNWFGTGVEDAITQMVAGERSRFWIPTKLSNHNDGTDGWIIYDIDLLEVHQKAVPPKAPKDVAKAPAGAKKTKKGVRYKFLSRGKSKTRPTATARVKVHYTGWTTDGRMFDSTATRGQPSVFPLDSVIAGWADAIMVMAPGDKLRAWIPPELAYKDRSGPQGTLVYDIELVEIEP